MKKNSRKSKISSKTSSASVSSQDTLSLIETDKEIQSYIYQQIAYSLLFRTLIYYKTTT